MDKKKLIEIIQKVLKTDEDLSFLLKLQENEVETLVARIREGVENNKE